MRNELADFIMERVNEAGGHIKLTNRIALEIPGTKISVSVTDIWKNGRMKVKVSGLRDEGELVNYNKKFLEQIVEEIKANRYL